MNKGNSIVRIYELISLSVSALVISIYFIAA